MDAYQKILQKTYDSRIPFTAHWELTYRCNLSCLHCYATNKRSGNECTFREIEKGLEQLANMGCLFLTFTGGEILCRKDLFIILETAKSNGFALHLFTNGVLITPETADKIAEIKPLSVEISLYSTNPDIHDKITNTTGSHEKTMSAIRLCKQRNINIVIKTPLLKYNIKEYPALKEFALTNNFRFVSDFILVPGDDGSLPMNYYGLSEKQIFEFVKTYADLSRDTPQLPEMSDPVCGAGSNAICISPCGDVFPCLAIRKSVGNIKNNTLKEIWEGSSIGLKNAKHCDLTECINCDLFNYCTRCSGICFSESGNLFSRSDLACMVTRATKRAIESLSSDST